MTGIQEYGRGHVLVLALNPLSTDARIRKQVTSLVNAGYRVSGLALRDADHPGHDLEDPALHIYRQALDRTAPPPDPGASVRGREIFEGSPAALLARLEPVRRDQQTLRRALRLYRRLTALHWSSKVRKARRRYLSDLLEQSIALQNAQHDGPIRIDFTARFEALTRSFCDTTPEWQARLADLGPPRVVHAHDIYTLAAGAVLAERYGAKLIYDAHEYEPENTPRLPAGERAVIALLEDRALEGDAALVTVSDNIARLYRRRNPGLDIALVYNAPDARLADGADPILRARIGLNAEVPLLAFVGLPTLEERGLGVVLEAMTQLPEVHLAVIGPRWAKQDAELTAAVAATGLTARVHLLEPVAPMDVITAIADADVSLCLFQDTSLNQRFAMPNKLFESLLAGVPLLVSDLPDMAALVHRMQAGLAVDQTDPDAVIAAIRTLLARRADFVPAGEARTALKQSCSWEGQEQILLALYARVLAGAGATAS